MFESTIADGVLQLSRPECRWLSTGWDGGTSVGGAAYNVTVPEGWDRTDVGSYVTERLDRAGFDEEGPALLTGVEMRHARGACLGPVVAYATVGLSNPAVLPIDPIGTGSTSNIDRRPDRTTTQPHDRNDPGTVNLIVGTTRRLPESARANLLSVVAEAKAATLLAVAGVPGTTTDAIVVADDPNGETATFTGSATAVGDAARACVREAVRSSVQSRYADREIPGSVEAADYGTVTDRCAEVFRPWSTGVLFDDDTENDIR